LTAFLRALAILILGIAVPLMVTSIGIDKGTLALASGLATVVGLVVLLSTFERVIRFVRGVAGFFSGSLRRAVVASSLALGCGIAAAMTWTGPPLPRLGFLAIGVLSSAWWAHISARVGFIRLVAQNRSLRLERLRLESALDQMAHAGGESERSRAVMRHVMNVLFGLQAAKEGKAGIDELGVHAWIEYRCLRATRDVLETISGSSSDAYRIELGILRVANEVIHVEMAAGDFISRLRNEGPCPVIGPLEETLKRKAQQGGFGDSMSFEFKFDGEPHHMIAFASEPLDDIDLEMLSLIASMFTVLKLTLASDGS
jgi:hypothetical protein